MQKERRSVVTNPLAGIAYCGAIRKKAPNKRHGRFDVSIWRRMNRRPDEFAMLFITSVGRSIVVVTWLSSVAVVIAATIFIGGGCCSVHVRPMRMLVVPAAPQRQMRENGS